MLEKWKEAVPAPVFDENPGFIELYWKAWELAWEHVRHQPGLPQTPYMDEALWDHTIWIWDTCFMALFTRYATETFPGLASLRNFYIPLHTDQYPPGELPLRIHHLDNPPLFAWAEWESFRLHGNLDHIHQLVVRDQFLQKHYAWFDGLQPGYQLPNDQSVPVALQKTALGYHWNGVASGMDNTPRGRGRYDRILWLDALAQQGLTARCMTRLAKTIGETGMVDQWVEKYNQIAVLLNTYYWDDKDGVYYDIDAKDKTPVKVITPAAFWPMLAQMCSREQAATLTRLLLDDDLLGGRYPIPSVSRNDPDYAPTGRYWRGGIWLPTAYMVIKALEQYDFYNLAADISARILSQMLETYHHFEPHTIWEAYAPEIPKPATYKEDQRLSRPDFCGWSALGPISLFIENFLGFHTIDAYKQEVHWRLTQKGKHGITNLRFGDVITDITTDGQGNFTVSSNQVYKLVVNGNSYPIAPGAQIFSLPE